MPFNRFRFFNGSRDDGVDAVVDGVDGGGMAVQAAAPLVAAFGTSDVIPMAPGVNLVTVLNAVATPQGGAPQMAPNVPLNAPPGRHFVRVVLVLADGPMCGPCAFVEAEDDLGILHH